MSDDSLFQPRHPAQRLARASGETPPSPIHIYGGVRAEDAPYDTGESLVLRQRYPRASATATGQRGHSFFTPEMDAAYEEAVRRGDLLPDDWAGADGRPARRRSTATSVVRYPIPQAPQQEATPAPSRHRTDATPTPLPARAPRRQPSHWKWSLVACMLAMGALAALANGAYGWWQGVQADLSYGYPRIAQADAVVGHNHDSRAHPSHFLVLNLHGQVDIVEIPAGDPSHALIYTGPMLTGPDADREVVTVSFADVNHDGRPDLVLHLGASEMVLLNGPDGKFHQPAQQPPP